MAAILAMFPGQGSQRVGMGRKLLQDFPLAAQTFEEAEDTIRLSVRKLCLEGPGEELQKTANQQPCILTLSTAILRVLTEEAGFSPEFFAGHSLGEYSALVAAGGLSFAHAVSLVRKRGQFMQEAAPDGTGAMAAVIGYDPDKLSTLCSDHSAKVQKCVEVVNYNSPAQQIISGHRGAVEAVLALVAGQGQGVRTVMLPVSAPFHSSLMAPAREAMEPLLGSIDFSGSARRIIPNLTGIAGEEYCSQFLIDQINHPVLWTKSLGSAYENNCRIFVETGPGKVLSGLARKSLEDWPDECRIISSDSISQAISQIRDLPSPR